MSATFHLTFLFHLQLYAAVTTISSLWCPQLQELESSERIWYTFVSNSGLMCDSVIDV